MVLVEAAESRESVTILQVPDDPPKVFSKNNLEASWM